MSLRAFLERTYGDGAFLRVVDHLPPEDGEHFRGIVLPLRWYPLGSFIRLAHGAHDLWHEDDFYERYGAFAAQYEISAFQRVLLRFTSPTYMLDRAGRVWRRFHDTGEWQVEGHARSMRGTLRSFALVDPGYCRILTAWIHRAAEMTGVHGEVTHPECRARGAEAEVFQGTWE